MGRFPETVLATLPARSERERIEIVLCQGPNATSSLHLRQQSWGDGVGWFTQSSIELEPAQVAMLKTALGPVPARNRPADLSSKQAAGRSRVLGGEPASLRLVRADSA